MRKIIVFCLVLSAIVFAIPHQMNYQGKITDASGVAIDGTVSITFSIYDVESGGTALWTETHPSVLVNKGLFDVILGGITPIELDFDTDYWIEITVESEVLTPRIPLKSVGYAYRAEVADSTIISSQSYDAIFADTAGYVHWDSIGGIPGDIADGDDMDTLIADWDSLRNVPAG
ncbi:hypothetical protein DRQ33_08565, partial [bacterium]